MTDSPAQENDAVTTAPAPEAKAATQPAEPGFDPVFLEHMRKFLPIEQIRENLRITPKGLFVQHTFRDTLVEAYQRWLESNGLPLAARTTEKIKRRIFAGEEPPLFFLIEGKIVLAGFLATAPVQQPQRYNLPYFLGSLTDSRTTLSIHDPLFSNTPGLSAVQGAKGLEIAVTVHADRIIVTPDSIKEFLARAEHSPRTLREFPQLTSTQANSLLALVTLLRKSRAASADKEPRLLPANLASVKKLTIYTVGSYEFICDSQKRLIAVLDLKGKNLSHFVHREMAALRQKGERRIGIFDLAHERDRHLGIFNIRGKKFRLATHALAGFVEHVGDSPEKRDRFLNNYTVRECFEKFSILYQTAQPIDAKLIQSFVADFRQRGTRFLVNGAWIFVLSPDGMISHCLARHARPREKRRPDRPRNAGHPTQRS